MSEERWPRRSLIGGLGATAATAALALGSRPIRAQSPGGFTPARHPEDAEAVYQELRANAVPNGHFMAAGVVGLTRAQEFGYSVLIAG